MSDTLAVFVDGRAARPGRPAVPSDDRGLAYGDGAFETILVRGGTPQRLPAHLRRLLRGLSILRIGPRPAAAALARWARRAAQTRGARDGVVRVSVTRGSSRRDLAADPTTARTIVTLHPAPPARSAALSFRIVRSVRLDPASPLCRVKSLSRAVYVLAAREARARRAEVALLLDLDGHLADGAAQNVFLVERGAVLTPPARCGALPGIARAWTLSAAGKLGVRARCVPLSPHRLRHADEAFVTSALTGPVPLRLPGKGASAGPVTAALARAWRR